jgi:hypothetical protein
MIIYTYVKCKKNLHSLDFIRSLDAYLKFI